MLATRLNILPPRRGPLGTPEQPAHITTQPTTAKRRAVFMQGWIIVPVSLS